MHTLEQLRAGELCSARHLKLSENLTEFPTEILSLKETLEVLDLTGNQLSTLPDELAGFGKLRIIFCSENRFTELPEVLGRCPTLTMVGFKANQIATVSAKALPAGLRWLILTDNAIEQLPDELGQCDALQKLMLAGNRLRELPASLANCRNLELLRIAANRIERFPEWLLSLPRLSWLAYSGNPFSEGEEARAIDDAHVAPLAWETLALGELLGQGASGVIHRATLVANPADAVIQASGRGDASQVAVKLFKGAVTSDGLPRCEMAASLAAGTHPNLIKVIGKVADHPSGIPALVMELIEPAFANLAGPPSLDSCTRDVYPEGLHLSVPDALAMAHGIASVAGHLHRAGIMHGDLYGHNILFARGSDAPARALLGDFGAASLYDRSDRERAVGLERLEVRAFGCLLEELLAHCDTQDSPLDRMHQLKAACLSELPADRPDFAYIERQLAATRATLS
ncbi:leucine-rich repeat-containing protein kinase family protein [Aeromonas veronii]|uniref:leucine-rich repeat-containing protein kinase family protein n=1 Tax=Aeromonas veronii TaxID=654 RepID=UPI001119A617|nr:leucine-rich repeat-containing protein kinase family protein [Aeromonas veronii]MCX0421674.1 leucine-rich repeat-containing serine/threonine-protein kinase [Aeromonas veronii]TNI76501.1 protein kinase [Aeromonas veronii]WIJ41587.1 leucine-rich repeat-containing protein kinase family protein [Aeromonas veronii]